MGPANEARYVVYIVHQLVCNDFPLCILLNHLIALFVHLHAGYLSATGGSFHSIAFSSHVFIVTFTFPVHLHLSAMV